MFLHLEHIGIAVTDMESANQLYEKLLGVGPYKQETVESELVSTSFFKTGQTKVELLVGLAPESSISQFIDKKGPGIHHIAFNVVDIKLEMHRLEKEGFQILHAEPKRGADNKWVCFVHPKSAGGVLIELCQDID